MKKNLEQKHLDLFNALISYMGIVEKITFVEIEKTANYLETDSDEALSEALSCFMGKRVDKAYNDESVELSINKDSDNVDEYQANITLDFNGNMVINEIKWSLEDAFDYEYWGHKEIKKEWFARPNISEVKLNFAS